MYMKSTLLLTILALMSVALMSVAHAQESVSCSTLTTLDKTVCTFTDGTGEVQEHASGSISSYSNVDTWSKLSTQLIQQDTDNLNARVAQLKTVSEQTKKDAAAFTARHTAAMKALAITNKKACTASGFVWAHGVCSVKEAN